MQQITIIADEISGGDTVAVEADDIASGGVVIGPGRVANAYLHVTDRTHGIDVTILIDAKAEARLQAVLANWLDQRRLGNRTPN